MKNSIFHRIIPTSREEARKLVAEAMDFLRHQKVHGYATNVSEYWYRLALDETVENSISHGNAFDPNKNIYVTIETAQECLEVTVSDEGPGFRLEEVPDPTQHDNRYRRGGRGLFLLQKIANLSLNEKGNSVTVRF